ncbi:ClpP/crotonase [Irpex lacteus]|nr:ClpP/crotonase [Irpex lacteus]
MKPGVNVDISEGIATITLNRPESLNALLPEDYDDFVEALRAIDKREDVVITVWQAMGRMFCAGTNVNKQFDTESRTVGSMFLASTARGNALPMDALARHSKVLVAALHGPIFGIAASKRNISSWPVPSDRTCAMTAYLGHFDFIYATPEVYLSVPFTFLGLVAEGGSSVTFVKRLGLAKANEALIFGKKLPAQELLESGFINKIFPSQKDSEFHVTVRKHLLTELESLDHGAILGIKKLIKQGLNEQNSFDAVNLRETIGQAERLASGIPVDRFNKIARKEIKHKL